MYVTDLETPPRYQSESSSVPSQSVNCGVTVAVAIADFYKDKRHSIEAARALIEDEGPYNIGRRLGLPDKMAPVEDFTDVPTMGDVPIPNPFVPDDEPDLADLPIDPIE